MRITHVQLARRVEALALLAQGSTAAEVADAVGVSIRTVRKWASLQRLRVAVPPGPLADALNAAFRQERHRKARLAVFSMMVDLALQQARVVERRLRWMPTEDAEINGDFIGRVLGPTSQSDRQRIAARVLEVLRAKDLH